MAQLDRAAKWLDGQFGIPGTRLRWGLDAVIGVVPVIGDFAGAALSALLVLAAVRMKAPPTLVGRMAGNVLLEVAGGALPIVGDVFDVYWRANQRNMRILREHLRQQLPPEPAPEKVPPTVPRWVRAMIVLLVASGVWFMIYWLSSPTQ